MEKTSNSDISTNQFIIVRIGNEQYGINIKIVDNIVSCLLYTSPSPRD